MALSMETTVLLNNQQEVTPLLSGNQAKLSMSPSATTTSITSKRFKMHKCVEMTIFLVLVLGIMNASLMGWKVVQLRKQELVTVLFALHPVFMTLGFSFFMMLAAITVILRKQRPVSSALPTSAADDSTISLDEQTQKTILPLSFWHKPSRIEYTQLHMTLMVLGLACIAAGILGVVLNKNALGKHHLESIHARFGLVTNIAWILAISVALFNALSSYSTIGIRWSWKSDWHRYIGRSAFGLGIVTMFFGLQTDFAVTKLGHSLHTALLVILMSQAALISAMFIYSSQKT